MYRHHGYNYVGIPAFTDYAHIKKHFEEVLPIRGRTDECRPLGRRRYYWYEIVQNERSIETEGDPIGQFATTYACRLYKTDVVEFFPNGDLVLRVNRWKGPTTMGMLTYATALHGTIVSASGKWYFRNKKGEDFVIPTGKGEELVLRKADDGEYRPSEIKQEYTYKAKRKELNRIRNTYKEFMEYARNMLAIDDKIKRDYHGDDAMCRQLGFASFNLIGGWGNPVEIRTKFLQKVIQAQATNDLDLMYKLATYAGITFGRYTYAHNNGGNYYQCDPQVFVRGFNEVLKYVYHDEVFEAVEVEKGKAFIDRNAKYVQ